MMRHVADPPYFFEDIHPGKDFAGIAHQVGEMVCRLSRERIRASSSAILKGFVR